jgi:hypothetical protein
MSEPSAEFPPKEVIITPEDHQRKQAIREFTKACNNSGLNLREVEESNRRTGFEQTLGEHSYPFGHDGKNLWMALDANPENLKTPDAWNTNSLIPKDHPWITLREDGGRRLTLPEDNPLAQLIKNLPKENPALLVGYDGDWSVDIESAKGKFQIDQEGNVFVDFPEIEGDAYECKAAIADFGGSWQDGGWKKGSTQKFTV